MQCIPSVDSLNQPRRAALWNLLLTSRRDGQKVSISPEGLHFGTWLTVSAFRSPAGSQSAPKGCTLELALEWRSLAPGIRLNQPRRAALWNAGSQAKSPTKRGSLNQPRRAALWNRPDSAKFFPDSCNALSNNDLGASSRKSLGRRMRTPPDANGVIPNLGRGRQP